MTIEEYLNSADDYDKKEYNMELVAKYPWCIPPNGYDEWGNEVTSDYDFSWTMLDGIPDGWRIAFCDRMCDEIQKEYEKLPDDKKKDFYIVQAKEKFGGLRIYMTFYVDSIESIIQKYSELSEITCVQCGKPASYISRGWICPWCNEHTRDNLDDYVKIEDWFKE